jgi:septal ring factor EnvC (AmiA/AmiB activator)
MKDKHSSEVIYALADYKQLVLAYRTKHAELIKSLTFWKTSVIWFSVFTLLFVLTFLFWSQENGRNVDSDRKRLEMLNVQFNSVSEKLARTEKDLLKTREELNRKEELIKSLEKNVSTASKKLLEKLLVDQGESPAKQ